MAILCTDFHGVTLERQHHFFHRYIGSLCVQGPAGVFDGARVGQRPRRHRRGVILTFQLNCHVLRLRLIAQAKLDRATHTECLSR